VSVEVDRGDRRAVGLGQLVDQRTEAAGNFALRGLGVIGEGILGQHRCGRGRIAGVEAPLAAAGAVVVDEHVAGDPVQPGGGVLDRLVLVQQQADQHVLGEVVSDLGTLNPAGQEGMQPRTHGSQRVGACALQLGRRGGHGAPG
jgi:hypothetical protein